MATTPAAGVDRAAGVKRYLNLDIIDDGFDIFRILKVRKQKSLAFVVEDESDHPLMSFSDENRH